ncbi:MAG: 3-deoxy-7-phosphoheptulonate synthase, partial [Treponema sp.]|nr:3-deoxy-7-phosphoheptulonate synthase [Treponema sp.]
YAFQGLGEAGLRLLKEAGDAFGMPVVTEVVAAEFLPLMERYGVDVYQIGARNMQNFELLKQVGKLRKPVILKRGLSATIEEWLMSAEYLLSAGTDRIILCERGIRTYEKATRNTLDLSAIPVLRGMTHLPVIVDPSHAVGVRDKVLPMALAAIAAGADGIIVEAHCTPEKALSDGPQALYPEQFDKLMRDIAALAPVVGKSITRLWGASRAVGTPSIRREKQGIPVCAYSGTRGAYAEQAIVRYFDDAVMPHAVGSFHDIFQMVSDGSADYGMVPIENTLAGSIHENYDNFLQFEDISIVGAVHLRIQHALLAGAGATLDTVRTVYSHPQAFSQCTRFLAAHPEWQKIDCTSTAQAAAYVAGHSRPECAAIASGVTASYYTLSLLADAIEDDPANYTRFWIIAKSRCTSTTDDTPLLDSSRESAGQRPNRASVVFTVKNEPGALHKCLGVFDDRSLNLTRLESSPVHGQPWHYCFYADVELPDDDAGSETIVTDALTALCPYVSMVRLLGMYAETTHIS